MPFFLPLESEVKAGEEPWFAGGRRRAGQAAVLRQHFRRPLYQAIIDSRAFRRLDDIRFLGAIDYLFRPNGAWGARRHSRYWHTLGVAALASQGARRMGYSERDEIYAVTAALLHDIGHAPLSHSLEPVFRKHFGLDHHQACRASLYGKSEAGEAGRQLHGILREAGLDIDLLLAVIEGGCRDRAGTMFSGPINVDTIDGIYRTYAYASSRHPAEPPPALVAAAAFGDEGRNLSVLDGFWRLKDSVYRHVIRGPRGIVADAAAQCYMETRIGA
ncbi:MAG: HD domain-containing protein, partial [Rhodospirillales bacterium]|nr:HD domain-containing protein [Rhodospirillales bacterium]